MLQYCIYLLYRAGIWLFGLLPLPVLFLLGQIGGALAWIFLPQYRALAFRNIRIAFGDDISASEARRLVRRHFLRLGANLLCSIKFAQMSEPEILARVRVENFNHIENCLRAKKPLVLLLSHIGPWELCAQLLPHFIREQRKSTIYQPLRNRFVDRHVRAARGRFGIEVFDRNDGFAKPLQLLRDGGAIGILSDQHAGDGGVWTQFFGRLASTTPLPALLARRTGAEIIALAVHNDGFARWRAIAEAPICARSETVESLTAHGNEIIEQQVRRAPENWFWVHDRWKTPQPLFLLSKYKRGVFLRGNQPLKPFRILLRSSNWLGDAVMSVPAVRAIKNGRPDAHVTVAAPKKIAAMWKIVPEVDAVIELPQKSLLASVRALCDAARFDVAILFPNSIRSALEVYLAGIPRRVGLVSPGRRWLLNQRPAQSKARGVVHQTTRFLELASTVGAPIRIDFPSARPVRAGAQLRFGLCPGAEYGPAKRWLPERFAEVASAIAAEFSVKWILFGTETDEAAGAAISALVPGMENGIGKTSLEQLIAELRECDLLLTNDTGTMHLAALLGIPVVAIFGSTEPRKTMPRGQGHRFLRHHVECSPCFLRQCPLDFRCMHALTSTEVINAIRQIVKTPLPHSSPSGGGRERRGEGNSCAPS